MLVVLLAFAAGTVTVLAPCILPVLPLLLSGGVVQGRGRAWGIILGVVLAFSAFTLTLSWLVQQFGVSVNLARTVGIVILFALGGLLLVPAWLERFEGWMSARLQRSGAASPQRHGFGGGLLLGLGLGAVWTPCAGPILATVTTLAATSEISTQTVFVTIAYALGAAWPMGVIAALGQRVIARVRWLSARSRRLQQVFGATVIVMAVLMATGIDRRVQAAIVEAVPDWLEGLQNFENRAQYRP